MRKLAHKLKAILTQQRGETLMEGIMSLLVFTILLSAVTMMINYAVRLTGRSIGDANASQAVADNAVLGTYSAPLDATLELTVAGETIEIDIVIADVDDDEEDHFFAFRPK